MVSAEPAVALLSSVILKLSGRCNINCSYCYMYNLADQTHVTQPRVMAADTIRAVFGWIVGYMRETGLDDFHVSLHGGEPLLAGRDVVSSIADHRDDAERQVGGRISLGTTTNGLLLDDEWIALFHRRKIQFGLSLDGPREYHDRHRLTFRGEGTHAAVEKKIRWILSDARAVQMFSGVLCVLHPETDGRHLIRYFYDLGLSRLDLLLPDQNHVHGTPLYPAPDQGARYGRVLEAAYREWRRIDDPTFRVRKFALLLEAMLGATPTLDCLGTGPITAFTVETSGEVEAVDTMKICGHAFTKSRRFIDDLAPLAIHDIPLIRLGLVKSDTLTPKCRACRHMSSCGGGYLPHRFGPSGFEHETVYCQDMMHICDVIRDDLAATVARARAAKPAAL